MHEIKWGIIGCGDVTEVKSGPAFNRVAHSSLVAVMRRDAAKAKDYADRHKVPRWYSNADELINDAEVNAIYIATPPLQHEQYAIAAMRAGKPVYVEKPMAIDSTAAQRIADVAKETGTMISVAHYRRELPLFKKVKAIIDSGILGDIRFVNLQMLQPHNAPLITQTTDNWRVNPTVSGGGLFHDLAPHQIDLMYHFFGPLRKGVGIAINQANFYAADDIVQGSLLFENNVLFSGLWCFTVPKQETKDLCEIVGSLGKMSFSIFRHDTLQVDIEGEKEVYTFEIPQHIQQPMIEKVVQFLRGKNKNPCTASEGVAVMQWMELLTGK